MVNRHMLVVGLIGFWLLGTGIASAQRVTLRDDCDPTDPNWAPTGGCTLQEGDVTVAEFNAELTSPLAAAVIGHQAWQNDPAYLDIDSDETLRVQNKGGRTHTFTEVEHFGGGRVPALNFGLQPAPECANATDLAPGAKMKVRDLSVGNHHFQCCIHPWMRTLIKVHAEEDHAED
jgi:hypothetical protein